MCTCMAERKYPIGIQTFSEIVRGGYEYVDKTAYVYRLAQEGKYFFLGRPRRFGKSLLTSTMEAYFKGEKDLFHGLAIYDMETEWPVYPVLHIDLNAGEYTSPDALGEKIDTILSGIETQYQIPKLHNDFGVRFEYVIKQIYNLMNQKVVVLVDEYDKPLLESIGNTALQEQYRMTLQGFYGALKSCDAQIRFAFLTGITRFGKLSVFSGLNNLKDISLSGDYAAICGITEDELVSSLNEDVNDFAIYNGLTFDETISELRRRYDGYQFSRRQVRVFNPFSLFNSFSDKEFRNYWYATGTPTFLIRLLQRDEFDLAMLPEFVMATEDRLGNMGMGTKENVIAALYQSGYLTLKAYDQNSRMYRLGFPNKEVEEGFLNSLLPFYTGISDAKVDMVMFELRQYLDQGKANEAMSLLKSILAGVPFESNRNIELNYRNMLFIVFTLMGGRPLVEYPVSSGRIDMLLEREKYVYIFEFKLHKTVEEAMNQMMDRHYADAYMSDQRAVLAVGVNFNDKLKNIEDWQIVTIK